MEAVAYSNVGFLTLMAATFILASTHTISPDHWFPFVMVGRANKWKISWVLALAALAGTGHVLTSVAIGLVGVFAEAGLSKDIARFFENTTPMLLIIFGFGYAAYAFYKQRAGTHGHSHGIPIINKWLGIDPYAYELPGHDHKGGLHIGNINLYLHNLELHMEVDHDDHIHGYDATKEEDHEHKHTHGDEAVHEHKHRHQKSGLDNYNHEEEHAYSHDSHSHAHDEHDHDHDDHDEHGHKHGNSHKGHEHGQRNGKADLKDKRAGWGLVAILGLTPCIALLPLTFAAVKYGTTAVILVNISFAVATVGTIIIFTWLGLKGLSWIKLEFFDEYGDIIAGVIIGLLGIATKVLEL